MSVIADALSIVSSIISMVLAIIEYLTWYILEKIQSTSLYLSFFFYPKVHADDGYMDLILFRFYWF